MNSRPSIVVLTPLKNDAWILPLFLDVTATFADLIIVADQNSTDGGREICTRHEKVHVIENPSTDYDEASRQRLLIDQARRLIPMPRILMALDTDEILTADSLDSADWNRMLQATPGTTIYFEKPNLYLGTSRVERRARDFPGAFVDDGVTEHQASRVHSPRIPVAADGQTMVLEGVKFMHYALTRPGAQVAKIRMYAALENLMGTKSAYWRRRYYSADKVLRATGPIEETPRPWLDGWRQRGIDAETITDAQPYWQDLALLDLLLTHGSRRFWFDDIWRKDWKAFAREHRPGSSVDPPPAPLRWALIAVHRLIEGFASVRRRLRH